MRGVEQQRAGACENAGANPRDHAGRDRFCGCPGPRLLPSRRARCATDRHALGARHASTARRKREIFHRRRCGPAADPARRTDPLHVYDLQSPDVLALLSFGYSIGGKSQRKKSRRFESRQRARLALAGNLEKTRLGRRPRCRDYAGRLGHGALFCAAGRHRRGRCFRFRRI